MKKLIKNKEAEISHCVFLDIGNSRMKILHKGAFYALEYSENPLKKATDILNADDFTEFCFSSVNPIAAEELFSFYPDKKLTDGRALLQSQNTLKFSHIDGIGTDRLIGLFAAMQKYNLPLITVDSGTAVTINAADSQGNCLGGAILPGLLTQIDSLSSKTWGLNKTDVFLTEKITGDNTADAMRIGVVHGVAGAVMHICSRINDSYFREKNAQIIITGGAGKLLSEALQAVGFTIHFEENLILKGLQSLYLINKNI